MNVTIRHVLVPVDFGPLSAKIVDFAGVIGGSLHAEVHLVHVVEQPFMTTGPYEFLLPDTPARRERSYAQARARLAVLAEDLRLNGLVATTEARNGAASDEIIRAAVDYGADLIVMGRGERGGVQHLLGGSIAEQVSRRVDCPVLTVGCHGGAKMAAA